MRLVLDEKKLSTFLGFNRPEYSRCYCLIFPLISSIFKSNFVDKMILFNWNWVCRIKILSNLSGISIPGIIGMLFSFIILRSYGKSVIYLSNVIHCGFLCNFSLKRNDFRKKAFNLFDLKNYIVQFSRL